MSMPEMKAALGGAQLHTNEKKWFPVWVDRYRDHSGTAANERLPLSGERVIAFLRALRDSGKPAWQRLQAARAIEFYRDRVLQTSEPDLREITSNLHQLRGRVAAFRMPAAAREGR